MSTDSSIEHCLQWPKGQCRRYLTCKFYHAPIELPILRPGQCSFIKNGAKRCESNATYVENGSPYCFDHTVAGRENQNSTGKRALVMPDRVTKRVSGKSRMVNPFEVGYLVGGTKKENVAQASPSDFSDISRPIIVDIGSAQGRFLLQLAQHNHLSQNPSCQYNYIGFELRSSLVDAANEVAQYGDLKGSVLFLQGDAKTNMQDALAPLLATTDKTTHTTTCVDSDSSTTTKQSENSYIAWLTIQFPDPWTKKKHHKRRLVDPAFVAQCAEVVSDARGRVYICSDRYDLACFMYDTFQASALWQAVPNIEDYSTSAINKVDAVTTASNDSDALEEEHDSESVASTHSVYREKDVDDTRLWLLRRPFAVGTERDAVAEKLNRPVHRAVFQRVFA